MKSIEIKLWGTTIGKASLNENNFCLFQYDNNFLKMGIEVSPIKMPLSTNIYSFKLPDTFQGLPGLLADSLPDKFGNKVIKAWLSKEGRSEESFSVLEKLCYIGKRGMGALEFYPILKDVKNKSEAIEMDNLVRLSNDILSERTNVFINEKDDYINQLINVSTSAGGARAKAIVAYNRHSKIFKSGQIDAGKGFEYYIVKFDNINNNSDKENNDDCFHTRIEYAYYLLAKKVGINISDSELIKQNGYHFMTKRFDRYIENDTMKKYHVQTLGGLAHFDYNDPGSHSYEEVIAIMKKIGLNVKDIEEFFRRMVFNVIYRNQDDHVKNISFIMDKQGKWYLSPAYDLTFSYNPYGLWTSQHQMLINGKRKDISFDDMISSGKNMGLSTRRCKSIIEEVDNGKNIWENICDSAHLPPNIAKQIANYFINF